MPEAARAVRSFADVFAARRARGQLTLLPYLMAGYPSEDATVELMARLADAGADGFELGIPFSDPVADGPTVQRASQAALAGGINPTRALALVARARARCDAPVALMTYMNLIAHHGVDRFCREAAEAGAQGAIVPDLPPEEAGELSAACRENGLDLISFVAPTTSDERLKMLARAGSGFVYCISLTGITGARSDLAVGLEEMLAKVRAATDTPTVVGFGISKPEHVAWLRGKADGAIVASALIDAMEAAEDKVGRAEAFVKEMRRAADG